MDLLEFVQRRFDQQDEDDRLLDAEDIQSILDGARVLDQKTIKQLAGDLDDAELNDDNEVVAFTMRDLFAGESTEELDHKIYHFRPPFMLHGERLRVYVDDVLREEHEYVFDNVRCELTFNNRLGDSVQSVVVKDHVVDWREVVRMVCTELLARVMTTPDIYGSKAAEWQARIEAYRAREVGSGVWPRR